MRRSRPIVVTALLLLASPARAQPSDWARELHAECLDRHGNPLPAGALLRPGTVRFRSLFTSRCGE